MSVTSFLGNFYVRVGLLPAAAVFLTVLLRRFALRNGRERPPFFSLPTFEVGFDLYVLAVVTSATSVIDRARELNGANRALRAAEAAAVPDKDKLALLHDRTTDLVNGEVLSAMMVALVIITAFAVAASVSQTGYERVPPSLPRRSSAATREPELTRRGVLVPFITGVLAFGLALLTSR